MSELKVNSISGIGGSVKINDPVGMGTNSRSGYALNTNGKINVEGSVEVVTIPASNFGVRIRAPYAGEAGSTDSILQFTNNNGSTELAALHARSNGSLTIWSGGQPRIFVDDAGLTFGPATNFSSQAKFNLIPPLCSVLPTQADHLANKAYVDAKTATSTSQTIRWIVFMNNGVVLRRSDTNINVSKIGSQSRFTITHNAGVSGYGILVTGGRACGTNLVQGDGLFGAYPVSNNACEVVYSHSIQDSYTGCDPIDQYTVMIVY